MHEQYRSNTQLPIFHVIAKSERQKKKNYFADVVFWHSGDIYTLTVVFWHSGVL